MSRIRTMPAIAAGLALAASALAHAAPAPLHVKGNIVVDSHGHRVRLRGVNAASLEWSTDGEGHILTTVDVAVRDWHANIVRLPLSQDRWFGKAPGQTDGGSAYRDLVRRVVDEIAARNAYAILDLHWSDAGDWGQQIGQHCMPDDHSAEFWQSCAAKYRNNPAVIFDLYNEPHDVTWDVWHDGGPVTDRDRQRGFVKTYHSPGMQALLDTVRATGARNVVIAGGLDWAYDLSGFLNGRQLSDPHGSGVIYANHDYPFKGDTFEQWLAKMETATKTLPVIVSEFGAGGGRRQNPRDDTWVREVLQALHDHQWDFTAWDLHPAASPCLISDWEYTPTPHFGAYVKEELAGTLPAFTAPTPPAPPAPPSW